MMAQFLHHGSIWTSKPSIFLMTSTDNPRNNIFCSFPHGWYQHTMDVDVHIMQWNTGMPPGNETTLCVPPVLYNTMLIWLCAKPQCNDYMDIECPSIIKQRVLSMPWINFYTLIYSFSVHFWLDVLFLRYSSSYVHSWYDSMTLSDVHYFRPLSR